MTAEKAFAYMADLRRFAEWDPGVRRVVQVAGEGGGPEAVFDVTVATLGPDLTLRYETTEYDPPRSFRVVATSLWHNPNTLSVYGVEEVGGYTAFVPSGVHTLMQTVTPDTRFAKVFRFESAASPLFNLLRWAKARNRALQKHEPER